MSFSNKVYPKQHELTPEEQYMFDYGFETALSLAWAEVRNSWTDPKYKGMFTKQGVS